MRSAIILRSPSTVDEGRITSQQASSDEQLLKLWLHGRSPNTQRAYASDASRFRSFVGKPLQAVHPCGPPGLRRLLVGACAGEPMSRPVEREVACVLRSSHRLPRLRRRKTAPLAGEQIPPL